MAKGENIYLILLIFACKFVDRGSGVGLTVNTKQGKIQGYLNLIDNYVQYLGIPYANFERRFSPPGDAPVFNRTFKANRGYISCKQYFPFTKTIIGQENCLTLSIYRPINVNAAEPLTVIAFIYGGGYYWGISSNWLYNTRFLIRKNVIVVKINYRIGAFGFLCLRNEGAPGNIGLRDQIAALKWIKNNIAAFGGDPNKITVFGESAGGVSVNILILTQQEKGLFQRAIIDSGPVSMPHLLTLSPIATAERVARGMGYNGRNNTHDLLKFYLDATDDEIAKGSIRDQTNNVFAPYFFKLCVEDEGSSKDPILTTTALDLLNKAEEVGKIDILYGYNNKEGIMYASPFNSDGLRILETDFSNAIPDTYIFKNTETKQCFIKDLRSFYFDNSMINYTALVDYFSDSIVFYPSIVNMEAYLKNPNITMYNYFFTYSSARNVNKLLSNLYYFPGANHADELFYLFDPDMYKLVPTLPKDAEMIEMMITLWTTFAKTGNPSKGTNIRWTKSQNTLKFLEIGENIRLIDIPDQDGIEFLRQSQAKYNFMV